MAAEELPEREPPQPRHRSWKEVATEVLASLLTGRIDRPESLARELIEAWEREEAADRATAERVRAQLLALARQGAGGGE